MNKKRLITKRQEQALKLCHHDFEGLEQVEAAKRMGITQPAIVKLLAHIKKVALQLFPILTQQEAKIYHYYMVEGWNVNEIAEYTDLSPDTIYKTLQRARRKGMFFTPPKDRVLQYETWMDSLVKEKF